MSPLPFSSQSRIIEVAVEIINESDDSILSGNIGSSSALVWSLLKERANPSP